MDRFFPTGLEKGEVKLPQGRNFGRIKGSGVMVYGKTECIMTPVNTESIIFVDVETPDPSHKVMDSPEIHFGCVGTYNIKNNYGKSDPRVDVYLPLSELDNLINILLRIRSHVKKEGS